MNDPSDEQLEAQRTFFNSQLNQARDEQSDATSALLDELGITDEPERVCAALVIAGLLGNMFEAGWKAGIIEAAAQNGASVRHIDDDRRDQ